MNSRLKQIFNTIAVSLLCLSTMTMFLTQELYAAATINIKGSNVPTTPCNGVLCISQGLITPLQGSSRVRSTNSGTQVYTAYVEGQKNIYSVENAYIYKGICGNATVTTEYTNTGNKDANPGFAENGGITGATNSIVKVTITGLPTDFVCAFKATDLDVGEGWIIANTYQLNKASVWVNSDYDGCLTIDTTKSGDVRVLGKHKVNGSGGCTKGETHAPVFFIKANSEGTIVLTYVLGTARHSSRIIALGDKTVTYNTTDADNVSGMPVGYPVPTNAYFAVSNKKPKRTGYTFAGWSNNGNDNTVDVNANSNIQVTKDITLWACWTPIAYAIDFNSNGGNGTMYGMLCSYGTAYNLTANAFTKTGYTFSRWNKKTDGTGKSYTNEQSIKNLSSKNGDTITLYAQWTPNKYTLTFNPNGGTQQAGDKTPNYATTGNVSCTVTYDSTNYYITHVPTRTGYTFLGWYTSIGTKIYDSSGTAIKNCGYWDGNSKWCYTGDLTVYAQWTRNSYTLDVNPIRDGVKNNNGFGTGYTFSVDVTDPIEGGSNNTTYDATNVTDYCKSIPYGCTYKVTITNNPTGYTSSHPANCSGTIGTSNVEATPTWTSTTHTFDVNRRITINGTNHDYGSSAGTDKTPSGISYDSFKFSMTRKDRYGTSLDSTSNAIDYCNTAEKYGTTYNITAANTPAGYTWNGNYSGTVTGYTSVMVQWKANIYYVEYNKGLTNNGGTTNKTTHTYDTDVTLATNGFTGMDYALKFDGNKPSNATGTVQNMPSNKSGKLAFENWQVSSTQNSGLYNAGVNLGAKNFEYTNGATTYAIAQWKSISLTESQRPTLQDWEFVGWSEIKGDTTGVTEIIEAINPSEEKWEKTYYAIWRPCEYQIVYIAQGASNVPDAQIKKANTDITLQGGIPVKNLYIFVGWNTKADGSGIRYEPGQVYKENADLTLYAQWVADNINVYYSKGLTNDTEHSEIVKATRNANIQSVGLGLRPYTLWNIGNDILFAGIGEVKGRHYEVEFNYNAPEGITKEAKATAKVEGYENNEEGKTTYKVDDNLKFKNWHQEGSEILPEDPKPEAEYEPLYKKHKHVGNSSKYGGCYTVPQYHTHNYSKAEQYQTGTKRCTNTITVKRVNWVDRGTCSKCGWKYYAIVPHSGHEQNWTWTTQCKGTVKTYGTRYRCSYCNKLPADGGLCTISGYGLGCGRQETLRYKDEGIERYVLKGSIEDTGKSR